MKLQDFRLSELLTFDPAEGRLMLKDERMLLFRQDAFAFLRSILFEQLGERLSHAILAQFGYQCGVGDYEVMNSSFDWDSEQDRFACGPLMHQWEGIVAVEPIKMDVDRASGRCDAHGLWRNSYEAEIHLKRIGRSEHPVCFSLTGYASGWATAALGRPALAIETRCVGKGDPVCEWILRPREEFGDEARPWLDALDATNLSVAKDLERQVSERTEALHRALGELADKNRDLTEVDRRKSEFVANVSHEFRTPLTLILGPLQKLLRADVGNLDPAVRRDLERMSRNGGRLYRLVNEMLDFSKLEAGRLVVDRRPVNLVDLVAGVVGDAQSQAAAQGLVLRLELPAALPTLSLDRRMIEKIVINLLGNALKFTPANGEITVALAVREDVVEIVVSDTGVGIPEDQRARVFERFRQVDGSSTRKHEGTGLGLALVESFAQLHGGTVELRNKPGASTCFVVRLPMLVVDAPADAVAESVRLAPRFDHSAGRTMLAPHAMPAPDPSRPKLVVADDNVDVREYVSELLCDLYQIIPAKDGREALEMVREHHPAVVVSDVMMPEMDGLQLAAAMKGDPALCHIPLILLTARADAEASAGALECGADDYVAKPFSDVELRARVKAARRVRDAHDALRTQRTCLEATLLELKQTQSKLLEAQKLEAIGALAAGVAHEINTPTQYASDNVSFLDRAFKNVEIVAAAATTLADTARAGGALDDALDRFALAYKRARLDYLRREVPNALAHARDGLDRIATIVGALKEFAQPASAGHEAVDLEHLLKTTIEVGRGEWRPVAELAVDFEPGLPPISGARDELNQVFLNLLVNAVHAISDATKGGEAGKGKIRIGVRRDGDFALVTLADDGVGIPEEIRHRVFEPFFTTKAVGRGSGQGLAVAHRLVQRHGGRIDLESFVGRGTTFFVRLPIAAGRAPPA